MAFGKNYAEIVGHLGGDVIVNHLASGGRVANLSVATDESYFNKSGEKVDQAEWHRVVTFQDGLIDMLERHATKGRLISVEGKLKTRRWKKDGEDSWRYSTEILVVPGNRVQFYDKPNRANGNGAQAEIAPANGEAMPAGGARRRSTIPASRFPSRPVSPLPPNSGGRLGGRPFFLPWVRSPPPRQEGRRACERASRSERGRESMSAVVNLRREPKLREQFEYAQVVNNTVLIDRRTRWGNPFRVGGGVSYAEAVARYRVHLWQRIARARFRWKSSPSWTAAGWRAGAPGTGMPATARCSNGRPPGQRGCWRSGSMGDAPPCPLSNAVPAEPPMGRCRWREIARYVIFHCATRARASNPAGPPLRSGLAQEALGRTVKVADREDRGAIFRTKFGNFPHQLRPRASRARCSPCARVTQRNITSGRNAPIAATRSSRRSS